MTHEAYNAFLVIVIALSTVKSSAMYVKGSDWPGGIGFVTFTVERLQSAEITDGAMDYTHVPSAETSKEQSHSISTEISSPSAEISTSVDLTSSINSTLTGDSLSLISNQSQDHPSSNLSSQPSINKTAQHSPSHSTSEATPSHSSTISSKLQGPEESHLVSPVPLPESQTTSPPRRRRTTSRLDNAILTEDGFRKVVVQKQSRQFIKPLYRKPKETKNSKPFSGIYQWRKNSQEDADDRRSTLLILPLLAMFIFLFAAVGRCINWCTEDVRIADSKHKHYVEPEIPLQFVRSQNSSLRSAYSHPGTPTGGVPAVPSPLLSRHSSGRSTRSLRNTPERRRRKPSVNLSADDVRKVDQRHRRPPGLAARTASGSALQRQISNNSLRRQVHLDKNKAHWGVQFEKRRRESDASSGIATTHGSTSKIKFDISPQKEVSSPSSQGYVSNSESFGDAASLPSGFKPSPLVERAATPISMSSAGQVNNSDLSLARALLQLQRLSLGVSMNVGASQTLSVRSESACSTTVSSPPIDENGETNHPFQRHLFPDPVDAAFELEEKDIGQGREHSDTKMISKLTLENVASISSSPGCDEMHTMVTTPSTSTAGEDSPSTVMAPSLIGNTTSARSITAHRVRSESLLQQDLYEEDPIFCAVQRISRSPYFHKQLQRMTSDDDPLCHSSGLSSKHSSCCSDEGDHSVSLSGSLRFVFDHNGTSPWTSFDQGNSPSSSISSGVGGVSPQLCTTAMVHHPPSCVLERQDSTTLSPTDGHVGRQRHTPRRRRELPRQNTTSLTALRRLHSKELLQKISKISQPGYPGRSKKKPQLNQCHSWCGPGTMETQASSSNWRKSVTVDREYYF